MGIIAQEYSLFEIDQELDLLMEQIEQEVGAYGGPSARADGPPSTPVHSFRARRIP